MDKESCSSAVGWVTLRDYVDARFAAIAADKCKSEKGIDDRLASMNEFRQAMMDQQKLFLTKEEYRLAHKPLEDLMVDVRNFMAVHQGKASTGQLWFVSIISVIGVILGLFHLFGK